MATTYKSPGVFIEEIALLPSSVAQVETAIPAFIGYTEKGTSNIAVKIESMPEYEELFGGPPEELFDVTVTDTIDIAINTNGKNSPSRYLMYYSMQLFFANGGGQCYIVSVGNYAEDKTINKTDLKSGLDNLEKEDEPTLILFPDATGLANANDFYELYGNALSQCGKLQDRFALIDVYKESIEDLRDKLISDYMQYGAAYYPALKTTFNYRYKDENVKVHFTDKGVPQTQYLGEINLRQSPILKTSSESSVSKAIDVIQTLVTTEAIENFIEGETRKGVLDVAKTRKVNLPEGNNALYHLIRSEIENYTITLPPSAAMAGIYARVDNEKGVWKAPANVGVFAVVAPTLKITDKDQEELNIDPVGGKSINVIRSFSGKGVLVWGARTLAGNDNEWRYVPVRRFFNMVEESIKKSTTWAVFETNNANTWIRIKGMIENYLTALWRQGALVGAKPTQAFFVNVGLGTTMTTTDILEGRMNIEIGLAAVRPSEFIILKFSHKLQEA